MALSDPVDIKIKVIMLLLPVVLLCAGCSILPPPQPKVITYYAPEPEWGGPAAEARTASGAAILVSLPEANAVLSTPRMSYVSRSQTVSYYARSHWVDTPARMLQSLMTRALERDGGFAAVVQSTGAARVDYRLDTEILEFHQVFLKDPGEFHVKLRAQLVDVGQRRVVATETFKARKSTGANNPHAGTQAAGRALEKLLPELARFCADHLGQVTP